MKICTFFTFAHVRQTCFASKFLCVHLLTTFSTDSKSTWNSAFFDTIFSTKFFKGHISTFSNFEAKRAKNGSKNQETYLVNVSQFCTHQRVCILQFSKKKSNSLYPNEYTLHTVYERMSWPVAAGAHAPGTPAALDPETSAQRGRMPRTSLLFPTTTLTTFLVPS